LQLAHPHRGIESDGNSVAERNGDFIKIESGNLELGADDNHEKIDRATRASS
jgi:hypothetical protein